jgi:Uma2 family endonuclease
MYTYHRGDSLTAEQYERLDEDGRYRSEMSRGLLVREPRPGALHARITAALYTELHRFVVEHDLGSVEIEAGFRLWQEPLTVRGPDVAFISRERLPSEIPVSWWPFAPDLAIEVVSPGKTLSELHEKIFEYFEAHTRQVWVVEPRTRSVTVYRSLSDISIVREPDMLNGGDLLPGLMLKLDSFLPR